MNNDLISRKALMEKECYGRISSNDVRNAPAIDAVVVVRCQDCGYSESAPLGEEYLYCNHTCMVVRGCDYCSFGEPKKEVEHEL